MTCSEAFKDELYLVENVHFVFIINPSPTVQSSFFPTTCFPFFWHVFIVSRYLTKGHHNSSILNKFILDNFPGILMILPVYLACHSELNIIIFAACGSWFTGSSARPPSTSSSWSWSASPRSASRRRTPWTRPTPATTTSARRTTSSPSPSPVRSALR